MKDNKNKKPKASAKKTISSKKQQENKNKKQNESKTIDLLIPFKKESYEQIDRFYTDLLKNPSNFKTPATLEEFIAVSMESFAGFLSSFKSNPFTEDFLSQISKIDDLIRDFDIDEIMDKVDNPFDILNKIKDLTKEPKKEENNSTKNKQKKGDDDKSSPPKS